MDQLVARRSVLDCGRPGRFDYPCPPTPRFLTVALMVGNADLEHRLASSLGVVGLLQCLIHRQSSRMQGQQRTGPRFSSHGLEILKICGVAEEAHHCQVVKAPIWIGWFLLHSRPQLRQGGRMIAKTKQYAGSRRRPLQRHQLKLSTPIVVGVANPAKRKPRYGTAAVHLSILRASGNCGVERTKGLLVTSQHAQRFSPQRDNLGLRREPEHKSVVDERQLGASAG